jgi:pimeloyl-ACP methyl ester carboxylesterase
MLTTDAEGHPTMTRRFPRRVGQAIQAGEEHFTNIQGPVLAIFAMMDDTGDPTVKDASALAAADAFSQVQRARATRRSEAFKRGVPQAQIVLMPKADHYVFLSHEQEVLQEIRAFVSTLR